MPYKRVNSCHRISLNWCWEPSWTTTGEAKQVASWHFRCVDWDGWIWECFATMCLRDLTKTPPLNCSNQDPAILVFLQSLHKAGCHDIATLALRCVIVGCMYAHLTNCIPWVIVKFRELVYGFYQLFWCSFERFGPIVKNHQKRPRARIFASGENFQFGLLFSLKSFGPKL